MKLFKLEAHTKKNRRVLDVLVHAESEDQALEHARKKFTGCELRNCIELILTPTHFVIGEWTTD